MEACAERAVARLLVVGSGERDPLDRRVDVHVSSIRRKLGSDNEPVIRTVHRVGYVID